MSSWHLEIGMVPDLSLVVALKLYLLVLPRAHDGSCSGEATRSSRAESESAFHRKSPKWKFVYTLSAPNFISRSRQSSPLQQQCRVPLERRLPLWVPSVLETRNDSTTKTLSRQGGPSRICASSSSFLLES